MTDQQIRAIVVDWAKALDKLEERINAGVRQHECLIRDGNNYHNLATADTIMEGPTSEGGSVYRVYWGKEFITFRETGHGADTMVDIAVWLAGHTITKPQEKGDKSNGN